MVIYIDVGTPKRVRMTIAEFPDVAEKYHREKSKYDFYVSLPYNETRIRLDYLFFDFDGKNGNPQDSAIALHEYLVEKKLMHSVLFSGRGFHVIVYCDKQWMPKSAKKKLAALQKEMLFESSATDYDSQVLGDLRRLRRLPNSYNTRSGLFCIFLTEEQLYGEFEMIKLIAKVPAGIHKFNGEYYSICNKKNAPDFKTNLIEKDIEYKVPLMKDAGEIPLCLKYILSTKNFNHYSRFMLITYLDSVKGYSQMEIIKRMSKMLPKEKFDHMMNDENQIEYVYGTYTFPSCDIIKEKERCPVSELCSFGAIRRILKEI